MLAAIDRVTYLGGTTRLKLRTRGGVNLTLSLASKKAAPILENHREVWINWPTDQGFLLPAEKIAKSNKHREIADDQRT